MTTCGFCYTIMAQENKKRKQSETKDTGTMGAEIHEEGFALNRLTMSKPHGCVAGGFMCRMECENRPSESKNLRACNRAKCD